MRYFYNTVRQRTLLCWLPDGSMILSMKIKLLQLAGDVKSSFWQIDSGGILYNWQQRGYKWGTDIDTSYIMYVWMDGWTDGWSKELNVKCENKGDENWEIGGKCSNVHLSTSSKCVPSRLCLCGRQVFFCSGNRDSFIDQGQRGHARYAKRK